METPILLLVSMSALVTSIVVILMEISSSDQQSKLHKICSIMSDIFYYATISPDTINAVAESTVETGSALIEGVGLVFEISAELLDW